MTDHERFKGLIAKRLEELSVRMRQIDSELSHSLSKDLGEQAIDLEDDEVLEGVGAAAKKEALLLENALGRIEDGSYATCLQCGESISPKRLEAVLHATLCRTCAGSGSKNVA